MRIIEQFVKALVTIIRNRRSGNHEEAFNQIQVASQLYLEADVISLINNSPDQLLNRLKTVSNEIDAERCIICADLLYELALIFEAKKQNGEALRLKSLCLHLYQSAIQAEECFQVPQYTEKVQTLIDQLSHTAFGFRQDLIRDDLPFVGE